jgi:hypothetical protein
MTKTETRKILAGAICHHLKGRGLWHPDVRAKLEEKMSEVCQQIMDDHPAGPGETIAGAAARDIWENDTSGRGWATVRREVIRRLEILG